MFRARVDEAIHGEMQLLIHGIDHARKHKKSLETWIEAPFSLPGLPEFIHQFSSDSVSEQLGFKIQWKERSATESVAELLPVIDACITPQHELGNVLAKRYLRWRERI